MVITEEAARRLIQNLKKTNCDIHISYHNTYPKVAVINQPARLGNVYAHLFEIEYAVDGRKQVKAHTYADLICKRLEIAELNP